MTRIREDMSSDKHFHRNAVWQLAGDDTQKEQWYSLAATVRVLKASQAMGRASADCRRGENPVELRQ